MKIVDDGNKHHHETHELNQHDDKNKSGKKHKKVNIFRYSKIK